MIIPASSVPAWEGLCAVQVLPGTHGPPHAGQQPLPVSAAVPELSVPAGLQTSGCVHPVVPITLSLHENVMNICMECGSDRISTSMTCLDEYAVQHHLRQLYLLQ